MVKKTSFKFPDYFMEEVVTKPLNASAHPVPPPPPEPPPKPAKIKMSDKDAIAEGFNQYYTSIGSKLSSSIKNQNCVPDFNFRTHVKLSKSIFTFQEFSSDMILSIIQSLQNKTSSGTDGISNVLIKTIAPYIIRPMFSLFNRSLRNGTVPEDFKSAKVIPICKGKESGSQFEYTSYRPISLLQSMSRVLEKLIDKQLRNYLTYEDVLYSKQFGFRGRRGCDQALLLFTDFTKTQLFNNNKVLTAFLDLKKAFDTVNHDILLKN